MPTRPPRPCLEPGCPALVTTGPRCAAHDRPTRTKDPEQVRFYGSTRWKRLRARVGREEPVCRMCGERPTAVVDHINGDWRDNRRENLRGLCRPCNATHTARQHTARREAGLGGVRRPHAAAATRRRGGWVAA